MRLKFALAALFLTSTSAFAADLAPQPVEPAVPVVTVYNWTGFYIGLHAGARFGQGKGDVPSIPASGKYDSVGFLGGAHAGYNAQFDGGWVVGLEADIDYSSFKKSKNIQGVGTEFKNEWQGSVRARAGYAFDNILPYVTAGVAFGDQKLSANGLGSTSDTRVGWTAGAGVEYAIDQNWIVRGEVRYVDLGRSSSTVQGANVKTRFDAVNATLGVSYKF